MYRCLFCRAQFAELPFYGCCSACYVGSLAVRTVVDGAHPQSASPLVEMCDEDEERLS